MSSGAAEESVAAFWVSTEGKLASEKVKVHNRLLSKWNLMCKKVDGIKNLNFGDIKFLLSCSEQGPATELNEGIFPEETITQENFERLRVLIDSQEV